MTEAEANRGIVYLTEAEAEEKSPFLGKTEAEAEDSVDPCCGNYVMSSWYFISIKVFTL